MDSWHEVKPRSHNNVRGYHAYNILSECFNECMDDGTLETTRNPYTGNVLYDTLWNAIEHIESNPQEGI